MKAQQALKINIGCGTHPQAGFVNCDYKQHSSVDVVFDCERDRWPFDDNSAIQVVSFHTLEHITNWRHFFSEMWRILMPNGSFSLQVPYGASAQGMSEPGHLKYWMPTSFCVIQPGYAETCGNLQHDLTGYFDVQFLGQAVNEKLMWMVWRPWRKLGLAILPYLFSGYTELIVQGMPLKTPEALEAFHRKYPRRDMVGIILTEVAWLHHWNKKLWRQKGRPAELVLLSQAKAAVVTHTDRFDRENP